MPGNLGTETINEILDTQRFGRLACIFADQPYIIPITYIYEDGYIYCQTNEGAKLEIIRLNRNVCFEVDRVTGTQNCESVVAIGEFEELYDEAAVKARALFMEKAFPFIEPYATTEEVKKELAYPENIRRVKQVIYRIKIIRLNGYSEQRI